MPIELYVQVNNLILHKAPAVEQVLFVQKKDTRIHGQMAGGEFCGNAARSLGYVLAGGKDGTVTFTMSGLSRPVVVEVKSDYAQLKMQTHLRHEHFSLGNALVTVIHLEGISHAVLFPEHPLFHFLKEHAARPDRWSTVKHVLDDLGLTTYLACGLIFVDGKSTAVSITPYIIVRDIETLYAETACASGSVAVASLLGNDMVIHQPSGESLHVALQHTGDSVQVQVSGSMAVLWKGTVAELEYAFLGTQRADIIKS